MQGKINRGRHTDHPAGRNSIPTNHCPPPPSFLFLKAGCPSCCPTNSIKAPKAASTFGLGVIYTVSLPYNFLTRLQKNPVGVMLPSLVSCFSAFVVDETSVICLLICWAVSKLHASDWWRVGWNSAKFGFFLAKFVRGGVKKFAGRFSGLAWPHTKLMCKFHGNH